MLGGVGASFDGTVGWGVKEGKLGALGVWDSDVDGQAKGLLWAGPVEVDGVVDGANGFDVAVAVFVAAAGSWELGVVLLGVLIKNDGRVEVVAVANGLTAGFAGSAACAGVGAKGFC